MLSPNQPGWLHRVGMKHGIGFWNGGFPVASGQLWNAFHNCPDAVATPNHAVYCEILLNTPGCITRSPAPLRTGNAKWLTLS